MNLEKFVDYCYEFYGPEGIYPMGATRDVITDATLQLMKQYTEQSEYEFVGDSIDREFVRDFLIDNMGYKLPNVA
jgi:hypothetical protein